MGQLISTFTRTFYTSRARPRRRIGGTEDGKVDVLSGPFRCRAILRACAAGGGKRERPAGTSEDTDRANDLLRRERERELVLLSEQECPSFCGERASGVEIVRNQMLVSLRGGGGELGNLKP
jgi:hypothetical protein